jgi:hypothetical protein
MRDYGTVTYDGKEYRLIEDAYADNYKDRVCYFAKARRGKETYLVRWEETEYWQTREIDEDGNAYDNNESHACDWDNPADVQLYGGYTWGGAREGAGRKSTGRKLIRLYVTDQEHEAIKKLIEQLRQS